MSGETIPRQISTEAMLKLGLVSVCPTRWIAATILEITHVCPVDTMQRKCDIGTLNQIWVGDISLSVLLPTRS